MEYKIVNFDKQKKTVSIKVTWDDGSTYDKRMMCDLSSEEDIKNTIESWLFTYAPMREAELASYDPTPLINQKVTIEKDKKKNK